MSQVIKLQTKRPYISAQEMFEDLAIEARLSPHNFADVLVVSTTKGSLPDVNIFGDLKIMEALARLEAAKQLIWEWRVRDEG